MKKTHMLSSLLPVAGIAAALLASPAAIADELPAFAELDADNDGYVSYEEAQAHSGLAAVFLDADTDGDGKLDASEFETALTQMIQAE